MVEGGFIHASANTGRLKGANVYLDTCPAGIATQNPQLRKRFSGKPEYIINFMEFVAQELREYMAKLGIRTVYGYQAENCLRHIRGDQLRFRCVKCSDSCRSNTEMHIFRIAEVAVPALVGLKGESVNGGRFQP